MLAGAACILHWWARGLDEEAEREEQTMAGRSEEIKGGLKEGLGKLTGDDALEAEGSGQKKAGEAQRKASGAFTEAKGNVKSAVGDAIDSPTMEAEGEADKLRGKAERA
jgi:uncharacterized protein YjbJ (UPF0337 family)